MQFNVEEGQDELVLDRVPNNTRHLVTEDVHDGSSFDLLSHVAHEDGLRQKQTDDFN